jgi:hypothetical protein
MEDVMYKRVLIGLLAVSMLAVWGTDANANNRVLGILVKHSDLVLEVALCGDPLVDTQLGLIVDGTVTIACQNPGGHVPKGKPGHPTFSFHFTGSQAVPTGPAGFNTPSTVCAGLYETNNLTAVRTFTVPLPPEVKCKPKWTKVPNSELVSVAATATWTCPNEGPASDCQNAGDTIEAVHVECANTPHTEGGVPCDDVEQHVGEEGAPPPPLPCVDIYLHCGLYDPGQQVLETVCGAGVHTLAPFTANNISYVFFNDATTSVSLHHCIDASPLSGATWDIDEEEDKSLCNLPGGCCSDTRWNDRVCAVEINLIP